MFLNIITPCSRPENLKAIKESINIPRERYRWIIVFDADRLPDPSYLPETAECYFHKDVNGISGNVQRNFALDLVKEGHVYMNDDDTILHPELWKNIEKLDDDFISFMQANKDGSIRLTGDTIDINCIDSHNFIVSSRIVNDTRWIINRYEADGFFAIECNSKAKTRIYINKVLSVYNSLR